MNRLKNIVEIVVKPEGEGLVLRYKIYHSNKIHELAMSTHNAMLLMGEFMYFRSKGNLEGRYQPEAGA